MYSKHWLLGAAALACMSTADAQQAPNYGVTKTVPIGAPDRWDYVVFDPVSNRVYASHGNVSAWWMASPARSIGTITWATTRSPMASWR